MSETMTEKQRIDAQREGYVAARVIHLPRGSRRKFVAEAERVFPYPDEPPIWRIWTDAEGNEWRCRDGVIEKRGTTGGRTADWAAWKRIACDIEQLLALADLVQRPTEEDT